MRDRDGNEDKQKISGRVPLEEIDVRHRVAAEKWEWQREWPLR